MAPKAHHVSRSRVAMASIATASVLAVAACPFASAATSTYIGIDGIKQLVPGGNIMGALDVGGGIYQTPNSVRVDTPQGFGILTDIMSDYLVGGFNDPGYDESVQIGEDNAYAALMQAQANDPTAPVVIVGFSQGSEAASNMLMRLESEGYGTSNVTFMLAANPVNPDGGLKTRFSFLPSVYVPLLGVTVGGDEATTSSYTVVIIVTLQHDGFADFPKYAINVVAVANALVGIVYLHSDYDKIDVNDPDAIVTTTPNGMIEHRLIPTDTVPLLMLAKDLGMRPEVAEALDPFLRAVIETGYDRPDPSQPGTYPDEAQPLRLLPPPSQWKEDVQSVANGLNETLHALGDLPRPTPVITPPPVDSIPSGLDAFSSGQLVNVEQHPVNDRPFVQRQVSATGEQQPIQVSPPDRLQSTPTPSEQQDSVQQPEVESDDQQPVKRHRPETNVLRGGFNASTDDVSTDNGSRGTKRVDRKNVGNAVKSITNDVKDAVKSVRGSLNRNQSNDDVSTDRPDNSSDPDSSDSSDPNNS